ncbi:XcbB/CpsF family capsular polysaccharide biosynthesis protein [Leuconostoc mesenteroides]|uniref:XcbB/CpsF family capsular polysaccharide biosynthesis protein n=1 Tax=Leuconostoc mesenteroides TaxID=1245 RepID=UPI002361CEE3|nr:XcbB/CpsF family capsular polysaccharide biosynthesis protein [Leuconostoc mesenteroides]
MSEDVQFVDFLDDYDPDLTVNKLRINMHSEKNMLQIAVVNETVNKEFKRLMANDYILGEHMNETSYFQKRKTFSFSGSDYQVYKDLRYGVQDKIAQRSHKEDKMVVVFNHFSGSFSARLKERMPNDIWPDIQKNLIKDTYVLRIMDYNLSHGSSYINTVNFSNYEEQIQELIVKIMEEKNIKKENVVLWGSSKGATGAFYHAIFGDYKVVAIDPILDEGQYIKSKNDIHFLNGLRDIDLVPKINNLIENSGFKFKKIVITNSHFSFNYETLQRLSKNNFISTVDIDMPNAYDHLNVVGYNSKIHSLTLLNASLDESIANALK